MCDYNMDKTFISKSFGGHFNFLVNLFYSATWFLKVARDGYAQGSIQAAPIQRLF